MPQFHDIDEILEHVNTQSLIQFYMRIRIKDWNFIQFHKLHKILSLRIRPTYDLGEETNPEFSIRTMMTKNQMLTLLDHFKSLDIIRYEVYKEYFDFLFMISYRVSVDTNQFFKILINKQTSHQDFIQKYQRKFPR